MWLKFTLVKVHCNLFSCLPVVMHLLFLKFYSLIFSPQSHFYYVQYKQLFKDFLYIFHWKYAFFFNHCSFHVLMLVCLFFRAFFKPFTFLLIMLLLNRSWNSRIHTNSHRYFGCLIFDMQIVRSDYCSFLVILEVNSPQPFDLSSKNSFLDNYLESSFKTIHAAES